MSGAIFGCSTFRKHKVAIFKVPTKDDEYNTEYNTTKTHYLV